MNSNLPDIFHRALAPFAPIDADNVKLGHALRESANDGEPAYIRMPELDRRVACGDFSNGNAWFETATGRTRYFSVLYDATKGRWLPIVERADVDGVESHE